MCPYQEGNLTRIGMKFKKEIQISSSKLPGSICYLYSITIYHNKWSATNFSAENGFFSRDKSWVCFLSHYFSLTTLRTIININISKEIF